MKRGPLTAGVSLVLAASFVFAPIATAAGHFPGAGGRVIAGRPFVSHPFVHRPFAARPFFPHPFFRPFVPFGVGVAVVAPPLYAYAAPPAYYSTPSYAAPSYDSSSYYPPPVAYASPGGGTVALAPSPRPMQTVVEYPSGRYELRGDGVTTPYTWVWIPNPPPAPPMAPPPAGAPSPGDPPPGRKSQIYRWIDGQGTVHVTDSLDAVPRPYRAQATQAPPS